MKDDTFAPGANLQQRIAEQYRQAYADEPGLGSEFEGWEDQGEPPDGRAPVPSFEERLAAFHAENEALGIELDPDEIFGQARSREIGRDFGW
jgi:hypothetical protein